MILLLELIPRLKERLTMSVDQSVITKIQMALKKTEPGSGCSEAEAQSALLQAQRLMAKFGLTMGEVVDSSEQPKREIVHGKASLYEKKVWWKGRLAMVIADNFR